MCQHGLRCPQSDLPVKKPTLFLANFELRRVSKLCKPTVRGTCTSRLPRVEKHQWLQERFSIAGPLKNKLRTEWAASWCAGLCRSILDDAATFFSQRTVNPGKGLLDLALDSPREEPRFLLRFKDNPFKHKRKTTEYNRRQRSTSPDFLPVNFSPEVSRGRSPPPSSINPSQQTLSASVCPRSMQRPGRSPLLFGPKAYAAIGEVPVSNNLTMSNNDCMSNNDTKVSNNTSSNDKLSNNNLKTEGILKESTINNTSSPNSRVPTPSPLPNKTVTFDLVQMPARSTSVSRVRDSRHTYGEDLPPPTPGNAISCAGGCQRCSLCTNCRSNDSCKGNCQRCKGCNDCVNAGRA